MDAHDLCDVVEAIQRAGCMVLPVNAVSALQDITRFLDGGASIHGKLIPFTGN
jgi:hypothetical protein